jgi:cell division protein FtsI/penicillin-binding protein 2
MKEADPRAWQRALRGRVLIAAVLFAVWAAGIQARLVWLQVSQHRAMISKASALKDRTRSIPARRGDIVDRHGRLLATSVDAVSICAIPKEVADPAAVVRAVCEALGDCTAKERDQAAQRLSQTSRKFAFLRRQVPVEQAARVTARIESLKLPGVFTESEPKRYYPNSRLAAHVLGYMGIDHDRGLAGIEQSYNSKISGRPGTVMVELDSKRVVFNRRVERPPVQGDTIELTLDAQLQHIVERELERGVAAHRADGGTAIIMDPATGEVLALANVPRVDPNLYAEFPADQWMNRAVQGIYEPGSTFKIVTASAAMEERVFSPGDMVDASAGVWRSGSRLVTEAKNHNYGVLSFSDVLVKSSNVGAIKIGLGVGAERLGRYVRRFGFGERSSAVSAVANGGSLVQPRLVRALRRGPSRTEVVPHEVRRVITRETAAVLAGIMEQVVERGTAKAAQIPGFTVAGKTGTASKIVNGRYSKTEYHASFVGFVPSRRPAFTILVVVDSPHAGQHYGGTVAAPIFQRIADAALRHAGVAPTINPLPPVLLHAAGAKAPPSDLLRASATAGPPQISILAGPPTMPDVRGLGAREAARRLARLGLVPRLTGDGIVIDQDPVAGAALEPGRPCRLWLDRVVPAPAPSLPPQ